MSRHFLCAFGVVAARGVLMAALLSVGSGLSLAAPDDLQPAPGGDAAGSAAPALPKPPGVFTVIGQWLDSSLANASATLKDTGEATTAAGAAAKDAVDAIIQMPAMRVANGRERCEASAPGAPDCERAAETLCRSKGWASRGSLDV